MKKLSSKRRNRDVLIGLAHRKKISSTQSIPKDNESEQDWKVHNNWVYKALESGLDAKPAANNRRKRKELVITLPSKMNLSTEYENTVLHLTSVRQLAKIYELYPNGLPPKKALKLKSVNFDNLKSISTSAALVLTAEIARWESSIRNRLTPSVENWDSNIYKQLSQLGFFELFENKPQYKVSNDEIFPDLNFVKYLKGSCSDSEDSKRKKKELKEEVASLVGDQVSKWTFLHSGLSEAVTNVSHHAYDPITQSSDKSWYLTGSYNTKTCDLKIAFYDQGIGIPNSLPRSKVWEKVLEYLSDKGLSQAERQMHAQLIKAAVSIDRTSTDENDRGKGLQDFLEFIKKRGNGYLSILSYHGLYKYEVNAGKERVKSDTFNTPLRGTLIIWSVKLDDKSDSRLN